MQYNIKGTDVEISDELRTYVEKRIAGADKLLGDDSTALLNVGLQYAPLNNGGKYRAECNLSSHGNLYRAEIWGTSLHEAIDLAAGELAEELRRNKKKRRHVIRRSAVKLKEYLRGWRQK